MRKHVLGTVHHHWLFIFVIACVMLGFGQAQDSVAEYQRQTGSGESSLTFPSLPQAIADPVDCNILTAPIVGYEISKGQLTNDVLDFLNDLEIDGFSIGTVDISLGAVPTCVDVLIVEGLAQNVALSSAYTSGESSLLQAWVANGHGLMLFSDWGIFRVGTQSLFQAFGYTVVGDNTTVSDPTDFDPAGIADSWVLYQADNFANHPAFDSAGSLEFLRSSWLDSSANSIVSSDADDAVPAEVSVMAAFVEGSGCVALSTDSNWVMQFDGAYQKEDNGMIARQIVAWLSDCNGLTLDKTASSSLVQPDQMLSYSLTAKNSDIVPQTNVLISDTVPANTQFVSATSPHSGPDGNGVITWSFGSVSPGAAVAVTMVVQVNSGTTDGTIITNTAEVSSSEGERAGATAVTTVSTQDIPFDNTVYLPLAVNDYCAFQSTSTDVILAMDSSLSMAEQMEPGGLTKLAAAQNAAVSFLDLLDFPNDQAGVVSFDETAVLRHMLSTDKNSLTAAIDALVLELETRIDLAFDRSHEELVGSRHHVESNQVIILLTDGKLYGGGVGETGVIAAADRAKADGIIVFTIGLGQNVNTSLLQTVATTPDLYYFAPSATDLEAIYAQIATDLSCIGSE